MKNSYIKNIVFLMVTLFAGVAFADYPRPWQIDFQEPASDVMLALHEFHELLMIIVTLVVVFVLGLMVYVCFRFSAKRNPVPSKNSHNVLIEIIWTTIPVLILVLIAIPSLKILYMQNVIEEPEMKVKVVGHQWYWEYQYPDHGGFAYDSYMIKDADLKPGDKRLLEVDNKLVIPVDTKVQFMLTSADVIHSFALPAFGLKTDTVPGRLNEAWVRVLKPGVYYGQCSELCGVGHGFMPIAIEVLSKEDFAKWVEEAKQKYSS